MGMVVESKDIEQIKKIAERERAPFYVVGQTTGDDRFVFEQKDGIKPIDLGMKDMFGSSPKTIMRDVTKGRVLENPSYENAKLRKRSTT